jgi:hypothetical protein
MPVAAVAMAAATPAACLPGCQDHAFLRVIWYQFAQQ